MRCPRCGAEYREGFAVCASCEVPLQEETPSVAPEAHEHVELVTVLEGGNPGVLAVAKSLLGEAGVPYRVRGEGLQDLFAWGRMGTGFNPIIGPVAIQVDRTDADVAATLLADLTQPSVPLPEAEDVEAAAAEAEDAGAENADIVLAVILAIAIACALLIWWVVERAR